MTLFDFIDGVLKVSNQAVVILGFAVLIAFLWWKRDNVMLFLTGDTVLHITCLDTVWFTIFKCCGFCTGDWTRCLTSCCPPPYRRINLVKAFGRFLGVYSRQVEIRNIVVGDLPMTGRGDFYVTVRCKHNPDLVTSVCEDEHPKVVHFPEVLTLKMRESWLEERVVIKVMELNVVGANELCSLHIGAVRVMEWADGTENLKRFEMKPTDNSIELVTPPWILLEFANAADVRELDQVHGTRNTITLSTTTMLDHHTRSEHRIEEEYTMDHMKDTYPLLDNAGTLRQEPVEADLQFIATLQHCVSRIYNFCNFLIMVTFLGYFFIRYYIYSCYKRYRWLEIAEQHNATFPIPTEKLMDIVNNCHMDMAGTGTDSGEDPCRPSDPQIEEMCTTLPEGQPHPRAYTGLFMETFGTEPPLSLTPACADGICSFRNRLTQWDLEIVFSGLGMVVLACAFRMYGNHAIRRRKEELSKRRAERQRRH